MSILDTLVEDSDVERTATTTYCVVSLQIPEVKTSQWNHRPRYGIILILRHGLSFDSDSLYLNQD